MKLTLNRMELLSAARRAAAVAPAESPVDVLKGTLLETDPSTGKLTLTATNLEIVLRQEIPCAVQEWDSLAVDAQLFSGMLEKLGGETVELRHECGEPILSLKSGYACYNVSVWERGYPALSIPSPEHTAKVRGIPSLVRKTVFATVEDKNRPIMKCVNLLFSENGLKAAGSDGICLVTAKGNGKSDTESSLLIPGAMLERLARMCTDNDEFQVGVSDRYLVFQRTGLLFCVHLMPGEYIDAQSIVNTIQNSFTVLTDVAELRSALFSVLTVDPNGKVMMSFEDRQLILRCEGTYGSAVFPMEVVPLSGTPKGRFWYLSRPLKECLRSLSGSVILGIAQGGILDLSTDGAYYMQNACRAPAKTDAKAKKRAA